MFIAEWLAAWSSGSVSLLADAIDFFGTRQARAELRLAPVS
jgi:Co/Zn/Cd efflux system component